ncbi:hypothetical protein ACFRAE_13230 [Sphingobacterium sp. HJSM2_6]|uniref:hypothetical protein n=1 Tax=Sphingobacterium sp. HJSM2_6 TaxID=3366264 RepID=UPI003BC3C006
MLSFRSKNNKAIEALTTNLLQSHSARVFRESQWDSDLFAAIRATENTDFLNQYLAFQDQLVNLVDDMPWTIEQEISALQAYFNLWNLTNQSISLKLEASKVIFSTAIKPLILFPLLKNSIQLGYHGMELYPIKVNIKASESFLQVDISNRVNHYIENQAGNKTLNLFEDRLKHHYSDQYHLIYNSNSNIFKVHLAITRS